MGWVFAAIAAIGLLFDVHNVVWTVLDLRNPRNVSRVIILPWLFYAPLAWHLSGTPLEMVLSLLALLAFHLSCCTWFGWILNRILPPKWLREKIATMDKDTNSHNL